MRTAGTPREATVQSVDRAVSILQALARHGAAGVTEIAAEVQVHKATAFRLLATLEARGLVEQDGERGRYRLGHAVVHLAAGAARSHDVAVLCRPICADLAAAVGDTVNVVVSDGQEITTIDQAVGEAIVTSVDHVGKRGPLHATAAGKVLLAEFEPERLEALLAGGLRRFTPRTLVDPAALRAELARVRERGWAVADEEHEIGLVVVAAPVRSADGRAVAAMTVGGPTYRVNAQTLPELTEQLLAAAARASWRLGALKQG